MQFVTDWKDNVGPGWRHLLDDLHQELIRINPGYRAIQVKEKFGTLRVYVEEAVYDSEMSDVILKYEQVSSSICERCGSEEGKRTTSGWLKTLCPACSGSRFRK